MNLNESPFTKPQYVRVLEHGTDDQIRIGFAFLCRNIHKTAVEVTGQYDQKLNWAGGFSEDTARKYYRRIAIVDATTLETVHEIYTGAEWAAI